MDCPRAELGDGLRKSSGSTSRESQLWPLLTLERNTETAFALRPHDRNVIVSVLGRPGLGSYLANFTTTGMSLMANESCTTHNESLDNKNLCISDGIDLKSSPRLPFGNLIDITAFVDHCWLWTLFLTSNSREQTAVVEEDGGHKEIAKGAWRSEKGREQIFQRHSGEKM